VALEGEDVFAGLEDGFDPLADRCQGVQAKPEEQAAVAGAVVNNQKHQVEVGVHRVPPEGRRLVLSTADFDLRCYLPFNSTTPPPHYI
jgi:hypothetical protein